jgi:hypothetical protein
MIAIAAGLAWWTLKKDLLFALKGLHAETMKKEGASANHPRAGDTELQ